VIQTISADAAVGTPLSNMVVAIADAVGKIYPSSLDHYGLAPRDRLGPKSTGSPYDLGMRIAKIFGAELDMYEHTTAEQVIIVEPFEPPALIVSHMLRRLPPPQQVFLLSYGIAAIASRLHPALYLRTDELEIAVTGAVRTVSNNFGPVNDDIHAARDTLRKVINRKWRRPMEIAAEELAGKTPPDIAAWQDSIRQTMLRAAMIVTDDLAASIEAMRHVVEMPAVRGAALVQSTECVRDLMRFWTSNRAASLRQHAGMVVLG